MNTDARMRAISRANQHREHDRRLVTHRHQFHFPAMCYKWKYKLGRFIEKVPDIFKNNLSHCGVNCEHYQVQCLHNSRINRSLGNPMAELSIALAI